MDTFKIQESLFELIKSRIGSSNQWVDEIAATLSLSKPAIYKRINGSTALSIHDLAVLMKTYDISFDSLIHTDKLTVDFHFPTGGGTVKNYLDFLTPIKYFVTNLSKFNNVNIWHTTSELHLFYYFLNKDLTNFKLFLHAKTLWNIDGYENVKFSIENFSGSILVQNEIKSIIEKYFSFPSIELWNENVIDNTLNQIKHFVICNYFEKPEESLILCDHLKTLVQHLRKMAEIGKKFSIGKAPNDHSGDYFLYHNELAYTNNLMLILAEDQEFVFTTYNNPNFMLSENKKLIAFTKNWFKRVKNLSSPVSLDSVQSRMMLFNQIDKKIEYSKKEIQLLLDKGFEK